MKLDQTGIDFIKKHEGLRLKAYLCPAGVWTIGYGQTFFPDGTKVKQGDKITIAQANDMFDKVVNVFAGRVADLVKTEITQNQFNALVSFAYNVGLAALSGSTLLKLVNKNPNDKAIHFEFMKWVKGGGKVLPGLTKRRIEESKMYND